MRSNRDEPRHTSGTGRTGRPRAVPAVERGDIACRGDVEARATRDRPEEAPLESVGAGSSSARRPSRSLHSRKRLGPVEWALVAVIIVAVAVTMAMAVLNPA